MPERRKRVRTGCLTCRQRRVKCDEGKPFCERCKAANISCSGYQSPRHVPINRRTSENSPHSTPAVVPDTPIENTPLVAFPNNPNESQRPHPRARYVLAHHQYSMETVKLLFRPEHLFFWRDHLLEVAWASEYVFDMVCALGTMHRSALLLSKPNDRWRGLDTRIVAFSDYSNVLRQISGQYFNDNPSDCEMLIAVLLLLVYFEFFAGNAAAAFRHFRAAEQHLYNAENIHLQNREVLAMTAREIELVAQIILPLPEFQLSGSPGVMTPDYTSMPPSASAAQERQQLYDLICSRGEMNRAIWTPLSDASTMVDIATIMDFQNDLRRWKESATHIFRNYDDSPHTTLQNGYSWSSFDDLAIPPQPQKIDCMDAAMGAALYNCYMGRTMWMLCCATGEDESYEYSAYAYVYHNMRILESVFRDKDQRKIEERPYLACNALKFGFIPLLYLGAQFCYSLSWRQWISAKLHAIGQEGLYNGNAFASTLENLSLFQSHMERDRPRLYPQKGKSPLGSAHSRIVPILLPDTEGKTFVSYYIQPTGTDHGTSHGMKLPPQAVGRASWERGSDDSPRNLTVDFYDHTSLINQNRTSSCVYYHLAMNEPLAKGWELLLSTQSPNLVDTFIDSLFATTSTARSSASPNSSSTPLTAAWSY
ncbi:hypothetical protein NA57DRAFT_71968 [Rhizodiscina lignyota]|uniref:Zn(2)-C6 fungal-type domain-containing protein n=1 Tax=Rhizodiscina lignyota TaxID=1504668 RepID=A0A9P4MD07_9PEZI|nr:hypothetical protein NA57DRAFT_71968 [Rhizodiscina lignyota]